MENDKKILVAVYGTLMAGERNAQWAGDSKRTPGTFHGELWDSGYGYPYAKPSRRSPDLVACEVLETDAVGLARMDVLEGYPLLYGRNTTAVDLADGTKKWAWVFIWRSRNEPPKARRIKPERRDDGTKVADWRRFRAKTELREDGDR